MTGPDGDHQLAFDEKQWQTQPLTTLSVEDFPAPGFILDLGGGGEGIITQVKGAQVVAIDLSARELQGIPDTSLRMVMDARDLKFLDGSFYTVTAFFALMFAPVEDHPRIFAEAHRVLKPGGRFYLWEASLPPRASLEKKYILVPLEITLPGRSDPVRTGFGVYWRDFALDRAYYTRAAQEAGFTVEQSSETGQTFALVLARE